MDKKIKTIFILIVILAFISAYLLGYNFGYMFGFYEGHLAHAQYIELQNISNK